MSKVMTNDEFINFFRDEMGVDKKEEITKETLFEGDLGFGDLDIVELWMAVEAEFDIEIDDKDFGEFEKVGDLIQYLKDKNLITD